MNFTSFGNTFSGSITGIAEFTTTTAQFVSTLTDIPAIHSQQQQQQHQEQQDTPSPRNRFQQQHLQQSNSTSINIAHYNQPTIPVGSVTTLTAIPCKFRLNNGESQVDKYNGHMVSLHMTDATNQEAIQSHQSHQSEYAAISVYNQQTEDKRLIQATAAYPQNTIPASASPGSVMTQTQLHSHPLSQQLQTSLPTQELTQDLCNVLLQQQSMDSKRGRLIKNSLQPFTSGATVVDYLSHLPANTLPLSLHHFLKYSAENIKKESQTTVHSGSQVDLNGIGTVSSIIVPQQQLQVGAQHGNLEQHTMKTNMATTTNVRTPTTTRDPTIASNTSSHCNILINDDLVTSTKRKKRKRCLKPYKPKSKPGEIRLTTALDGSCLYICPECQVAYPELELLEIHLIGHNSERRYVCDICQAVLKRKDHLTRHKQSHNPDRPFMCTICLKAFKRKEQLTLHFIIHSGEKKHICQDCGKRFYRKDHLRKHTRSHIARRVKAELSLQRERNEEESSVQQKQTDSGI